MPRFAAPGAASGSPACDRFLNSHNERLVGQPLYVALESDEGLLRVEGLLGEIGEDLARRV
jgi:hypothetical protein